MNFLSVLFAAWRLWQNYGTTFETGIAILDEVSQIDNGKLMDDIDAIFKKHGVDLATVVKTINAAVVAGGNVPVTGGGTGVVVNDSGVTTGTSGENSFMRGQ